MPGVKANPSWKPMSGVLLRFCRFSVIANEISPAADAVIDAEARLVLGREQLVQVGVAMRVDAGTDVALQDHVRVGA